MLFSTYLQKVRSNKTNKKQFTILEKGKYVMADQIFEASVGIGDDLTMNDDEYLQLVEHPKMQKYKCCMTIFVHCYFF